jgi:hypothetical protein
MKWSPISKLALIFALVGVLLMTLTLVWRINPVEGSVVPDFLTGTPLGRVVVAILLGTCMPVWILSVWIGTLLKIIPFPVMCGLMILLQALAYGLAGAGISAILRIITAKDPTTTGS